MSLWKFGTFEQEIDFTDADFMDALEEAQEQLVIQSKETPTVGKKSDIIRAQVDCFAQFFDHIFGPETSEKMYEGRVSLELAIQSAESFSRFGEQEGRRMDQNYSKYYVNANRNTQQRQGGQKGQHHNR